MIILNRKYILANGILIRILIRMAAKISRIFKIIPFAGCKIFKPYTYTLKYF